jgi:hypothetical protein
MSEVYKYNNPQGLLVGQRVKYHRVCTLGYYMPFDSAGPHQRVLNYGPFQSGYAQVIGCVKRGLGKYVPAHRNGSGDDYEPAYLKVSKYVWLYELRKDIAGKTFLVHPDDIQQLPRRLGRSEQLIGELTKFLVDTLSFSEWRLIQETIANTTAGGS